MGEEIKEPIFYMPDENGFISLDGFIVKTYFITKTENAIHKEYVYFLDDAKMLRVVGTLKHKDKDAMLSIEEMLLFNYHYILNETFYSNDKPARGGYKFVIQWE